MHGPESHAKSSTQFYIVGEVTIHPTAVIGAEVLLQADPGSQVVIQRDACIGSGSVLHAQQGTLEIGPGCTLGRRVLVVGLVQLGANVCVGSNSTIINCSVQDGEAIAPDSFRVDEFWSPPCNSQRHEILSDQPPQALPNPPISGHPETPEIEPSPPSSSPPSSHVYGRESVTRLMRMMFPYHHSYQSKENGNTENGNTDG